jgi:hypothetical protein
MSGPYAGDQVGATARGDSFAVATNYLKTKPSTRFSTRDLAFLVIDYDNNNFFNNYEETNSSFTRVVRLVQTQAEVYGVGEPYNGVVTIIVAIDTTANGSNGEVNGVYAHNQMAKTMYDALTDGGLQPDSLHFRRLRGGDLNSSQDMLGYGTGGETYVD